MAETEFEGGHRSRIALRSWRAVRPACGQIEQVVGASGGQRPLAEADDDVHPLVGGQAAQFGGRVDPVPEVVSHAGEVRPEIRPYRVGIGEALEAEPAVRVTLDPEDLQARSEVGPPEFGRRLLLVPHRSHQAPPCRVDDVGVYLLEDRRREEQGPLGGLADRGHLPCHLVGTVGHRVQGLPEPGREAIAEPAAVAGVLHQPGESYQFPHGGLVAQALEVGARQVRGPELHPVHAEVPGEDGEAPWPAELHRVLCEVRRVVVSHGPRQDDDHVGPRLLYLRTVPGQAVSGLAVLRLVGDPGKVQEEAVSPAGRHLVPVAARVAALAGDGELLETDPLLVNVPVLTEPVEQHDRGGAAAAAWLAVHEHHRAGLLQEVGGDAVAGWRDEPVRQVQPIVAADPEGLCPPSDQPVGGGVDDVLVPGAGVHGAARIGDGGVVPAAHRLSSERRRSRSKR
ncbi:hypothetical protein [Streptomyces virginiae]